MQVYGVSSWGPIAAAASSLLTDRPGYSAVPRTRCCPTDIVPFDEPSEHKNLDCIARSIGVQTVCKVRRFHEEP